ncbi:hypothetical protein CTAYLR_006690 [Chrysophaeum taylorii]|uniref:Glucose-methanol-choline oxidoreductase N-terminal domain-containing protein n=1 Tax=Chrysophaeum taylorii TaxID=2483200 RepID=A0AAD7UDS7_9STRA|nr:hypothetical protein CTAYLR_006690 [Chrysophaeum taylorii]
MHFREWNWKFSAKAESRLRSRRITCPRGRGLGGTSSINGMVYVRGHARDYDAWEAAGAAGWSWCDVAAYFKRMENYNGPEDFTDLRGRDGPLHVKVGDNALETPLFDEFIKAGSAVGYGDLGDGDYNGVRQEGLGLMPATIFHSGPREGERCSTAAAYLELARAKYDDEIAVATRALAAKVLLDDEDRAVGVRCVDGREFLGGEVVVCAGAIGSPHLLQVSGIGGPEPRIHSPGVGENLQDHLEFYLQFACDSSSLAPYLAWHRKLAIGARWMLAGTGLGATNHFEAGGFLRSRAGVEYPDVQLHFLPVAISYDGVTVPRTPTGHSFQLHVGCNRSPSRGHVKALSNDITHPPDIDFNYMSTDDDWRSFRRALRLSREIVARMDVPGVLEVSPAVDDDAQIDAYLAEHLESAYHPCGTCKMGAPDDDAAVCDPDGSVRGAKNLRVVDASLFPTIPNGNLNAPTIMVAEKLSDTILGNTPPPVPLAALQNPHGWIDPTWQSRQRVAASTSASAGEPSSSSSSSSSR